MARYLKQLSLAGSGINTKEVDSFLSIISPELRSVTSTHRKHEPVPAERFPQISDEK